ncbi:MAG: hypothetical protein OXG13_11510 [Gemmatimonadaceae bacterium]|nr:hypothetical protein [Gemmatimonadaceae bacterium]
MRDYMVLAPWLAGAILSWVHATAAQEQPLVEGGIGDKPFLSARMGQTRIGGYSEVHFRYGREDGITREISFVAERFNLFSYTPVSDRLRVASELEFEEGGEEIKIEIAVLDFELHPALTFRGGILLSPLGRFNLSHDSPVNDLTDRPLVSTEIIPTALSEAGMGIYGAHCPTASSRVTYELYAVNGFDEGVIEVNGEGTRIPEGRGNWTDNNNRPSLVGRLAVSPRTAWELGVSLHTGPYNEWEADGLAIDVERGLTIWALDWDASWRGLELLGEYARAAIEVPAEMGLLQESQAGVYVQANVHFGRGLFSALPESVCTGVLRYGTVDYDADAVGDSRRRLTYGLNFRPTQDSVFKLDYQRDSMRDPFNNEVRGAALLFSAATYF